jgi:hypothetical protein
MDFMLGNANQILNLQLQNVAEFTAAAVDENTPRYLKLLVINFLATTL